MKLVKLQIGKNSYMVPEEVASHFLHQRERIKELEGKNNQCGDWSPQKAGYQGGN